MALFHFNVRQAARYTPDDEGEELDAANLAAYAQVMAQDMLTTRSSLVNYRDCELEITDASGAVVYRLRLDGAARAPD